MKKINRLRMFSGFSALFVFVMFFNSCNLADDVGGNATVAKIEGEWSCDEQSEYFKSTAETFSVYISEDPGNSSGVIIDNFYGINAGAKATIAGLSLIISNQTLEGDFEVSGSGTISANYREINLTYTVDDGSGVIDHVTAVYTKM
jgi:hypothetical protein